jgi:PKD repeat protein
MKKITLILSGVCMFSALSAQKLPMNQVVSSGSVAIQCSDFHITRPLSELAAENPVDDNAPHPKAWKESPDRKKRKPHNFPFTVEKDGPAYGNDEATIQREMGTVPNKAPIMNFLGGNAAGFRPMDPSGSVSSTHYIQAINACTFRVYNKSTGALLSTANVGSLWSPATSNDGDPIIMYDKAADRWFISQFGTAGNNMFIAISQTNNPLGSYYTYTFTSPEFPDYLKFGVWQDGYYMTSNQTQRVFVFERTAMLAGNPAARAVYTNFSPPQGGGFFVPMPGDASDGVLPPAGTPCPIFSYSDNGWGGGFTDAVNIYKMAVNWTPTTPTATITSAGVLPTAPFDGSYSPSWDDIPQPNTTQKLDGIGGIVLYRAQWKSWAGYNTVCLTWAVRISASQRSLKWCELRQNQSTGAWSIYQEGTYTPDAATRWMGGIAMDNNGAIGFTYLKSDATSIYPGLYYAGRRPCDPLGTMPVTESVAIAGTGSQTGGVNRDGDYSQLVLDPDGVTFWCTSEYMGGTTGASAARTRIFSFQLPTCGPAAPVANFTASNTAPCVGSTVTFTDISTNTPTSWAWTFSPTSVTYVGGTTAASQHPQVQFNTVGPYTVTLLATNASGNDSEIKTSYITPISGGALPVVQNFEGATFPPTGWSVQNADAPSAAWGTAGAKGLVRRPAAGNTGSAAGSAAIECWNYNTDTMQVDNLLSSPISLVGATAPRMTFKRAYRYYNDAASPNNYHDELRVYVSTDCGATYGSAVYYKKGVQLATSGTTNATFTPSVAADWDTDTVNLASYVGQNIVVKFEVTNRYGQNLYLDDININSTAGAVASVNIASSDTDNTICAGTSVTFTATPTNGGTSPSYQWQVNGSNVGTNSPTYTTTGLTNGQVVTVIMTSNLAGVTGSPATSNAITMTVNAIPSTPAVTTSSPDCAGQTISLNTPTVTGATYAWTGPASFTSAVQNPTRPSATTAMAGTYSVTVTVNGCTSAAGTASVVVNALPATPAPTSNSPVCVGSTITLSTPAVAGATYAWTGPASFTSAVQNPTRPSATAAMAGTYSVTVTTNGCTSLAGTVAVVVNNIPATPTITTSSPDCAGQTISLNTPTVAGATYAWTGPASFTSAVQNPTRPSATAAMAGTYSVTVTVGGCTSAAGTSTVVINAVPATPAVTASTPVCVGSTIALSTPTVAGATYAWTGPASFTSAVQNPTRPSATAAMAGTYSLTVTTNGCTSAAGTATVVVNAVPATPTVTTSSPDCAGQTISLNTPTVAGATYAWTGPASFTSAVQNPTRPSATAAMAGTYSVTVTVGGCTSAAGTSTVVINAVPATPAVTASTPVCVGSTITLSTPTVAGATYAWTGPAAFTSTVQNPTRPSATAAMAGTYSVTVTTNGCTSIAGTAAVTVVNGPTAQAATTTPTACGASTGTITLGATTGGTGPYAFSVNGSAFTTTTSYTALAAGSYPVVVQDANGCQFSTTATVSNSSGPTALSTSTTNATCGASNGSINIGAATGGTSPYTYSVNGSGFTTTVTYTGLAAGSYPVIVKDAAGCMFTTSATITNTPGPTAQAVSTVNAINIGNTTGGTAAYMYSVNGGASTTTVTYNGLAAGTYTVVVTDANSCTFSTTATVTNIPGPTATVVTSTNSNCGASDGSIMIGATTGGTAPYTYSVNGSGSTPTTSYTGFTAGTYPVVVTDANGCTFTTSANVGNTGSTPSTPTISQLGLDLTSSSASGNQWYLDGNPIAGATGQTYTVLANGTYTVVVTTGGCASAGSAPVVITSVGIVEMSNPYGLLIYPNPNDGNFNISFYSAERGNYTVEIVNALGQLIFKDDLKDFSGSYNKKMSVVEYGQGIYTISLTNSKKETVKKIVVY